MPYNHKDIETKWIQNWSDSNIYKTPAIQSGDKKKYILETFPYPSADGLHVGHTEGYTASDITARYSRMNGYKVLYPMGWDAFGLPTENFAKKKGLHPQDVTLNSIANFKSQVMRLGTSYDWEREINTSEPGYYKWTQWFFQLLYKRGLAYKKEALVNWDPVDMTVLANEQVLADGTAERSGAKVEQKMMSQWFFKITDYAERLLNDLDGLDWPESTKLMQKNWIGKSVGAEVEFAVEGNNERIKIFTTRVDTIFGVTYLVLAPEHHLVDDLTTPEQFEAVAEYKEKSKQKSQFERTEMNKDKSGVFTGSYCINPFNGDKVPVWIGDYVLASYGTGAVMAVPAHDERDYEFAKKYNLEIKNVIAKKFGDDLEGAKNNTKSYAVLFDQKIQKYGIIQWDDFEKSLSLPGGTNDNQETELETLEREIAEETGFYDFESVTKIPFISNCNYYSFAKKTPTNTLISCYAVVVNTGLSKEKNLEDYEQGQEVAWLEGKEILERLNQSIFPDSFNKSNIEIFKRGVCILIEQGFDKVSDKSLFNTPSKIFTEYGILSNSQQFDNLTTEQAKIKMAEFAQDQGFGNAKVTYRLRDWSIGRQRYWGCPIPVVYGENKNPKTILVDAVNTLFVKNGDELTLNLELAECLKSIDVTKIILTNAKDGVLVKLEDLIKEYNWKIFSLKFEPEKTDPEYYKIAVTELNIDIKNTIYFDHSEANLNSAKLSNINSFQYLNNKQTIELVGDFVNGVKLVPESDLPVLLPQDLDLSTGMIKPLRSNMDFINSGSKYGEGWTREGDTMDTFVCSSWYFFRYCSGNIDNAFANPEDMKQWMPVNQYIIGAEHSTMHLLYARFFTKVLHDAGYIEFSEPFTKMRHQGLILGPDGAKMSKSKGNVINPNEVFDEYGADTLRMYEMFMGPFDQPKPWSTSSIKGVRRFLDRVWNMQELVTTNENYEGGMKVEVALHKLVKKIGEDIESYGFNTCVSEFMKFVNLVEEVKGIHNVQYGWFLRVLAPFAPFITEEIWNTSKHPLSETSSQSPHPNPLPKVERINSPQPSPTGEGGSHNSIHLQSWPVYYPEFLVEETVTIGVQINGKARGEVELSPTETEENAQKIVMELDFVKRNLEGKTVRKFVYVPGRIVNVVVG
jgi:leucyl-tRNA synthetase